MFYIKKKKKINNTNKCNKQLKSMYNKRETEIFIKHIIILNSK